MPSEMMLVGGSGHGLWWPVKQNVIAYRTQVYYSHRIYLPGWEARNGVRIALPVYLYGPIYLNKETVEPGKVLPGAIMGEESEAVRACRWCYGNPYGATTCDNPACATNFAAVVALDTLTADDARNWSI